MIQCEASGETILGFSLKHRTGHLPQEQIQMQAHNDMKYKTTSFCAVTFVCAVLQDLEFFWKEAILNVYLFFRFQGVQMPWLLIQE